MEQGFADNAGPCSLRYMAPAPELRALISSYYVFRADLHAFSDILRADLAQLRFMIAGHGDYRFGGGPPQPTPPVCLIGPTTTATSFAVTGPLMVFGVGILPAGWAALIRDDASRFATRVEDATALSPLFGEALEQMGEAPSPRHMAEIADTLFRALLLAAPPPPLWFTRLADTWLVGDASPQVDALVESTGMSARQVERISRRIYGAPPKLLARKFRTLRAASLIANAGLDWEDATGDAFYDQSHFIRDFKRFTGMTPRRFMADAPPVTTLTLRRRALAGKIPDISALT
jgi:AraC-like DNA-binding protein